MLEARIGSWYEDIQNGTQFKVVAIDEDAQTIEAQMIEGEICEYDLDSWDDLQLRSMDEPEDWRNPYELSDEDARDPDAPLNPEDLYPLDNIEPDASAGLDDEFA